MCSSREPWEVISLACSSLALSYLSMSSSLRSDSVMLAACRPIISIYYQIKQRTQQLKRPLPSSVGSGGVECSKEGKGREGEEWGAEGRVKKWNSIYWE